MKRSLVTVNITKILYFLMLSVILCFGLRNKVYAAEEYLIEFYDEENNLISSEYYEYGDTIYIPDDPVKDADESYEYRFEGWGDAVHPICTKSRTYKAEFSRENIYYNVRIVDYDGNELDGYYTRYVGNYGDSLYTFSNRLKQYFKNDAFMSDDIKEGSPYSSNVWADFCRAVAVHGYPYNPEDHYECIGVESLTDGKFYKPQDFENMTLTRSEDFRIVFSKKAYIDPSECDINYKYIADFDPDDPTRELDYEEVDESKTIIDLYYKEGEIVYKPIGTIPFPETVTSTSGQTYYLSEKKRLFYYNEYNTYDNDIITDYHMLMDTYASAGKFYILPVYEEWPSGKRMESMSFDWDTYDADGNRTGYASATTYPVIPFDVPENVGYTTYDNGHETRTFAGTFRVVVGNNRTIAHVTAGDTIYVPQEWIDYNGGFAFLVDEYTAVTNMYDVKFIDYDGAYFRNYHIRDYAKMYIPEDPVRDPDDDYTYEFEGWMDESTGEIATSISDRCSGNATYVATYKATKILKSTFSVSVPAKISLTEGNDCFTGGGEITVSIDTNDERFYVDVVADSNLTLRGMHEAEELLIAITQDQTRFRPDGEGETVIYSSIELASSTLPLKADVYEGDFCYVIGSGYVD